MNKKKIDYRFKILYAVAILMVVAGHCDGGGISLDFAQWFPYEGIHLALFTFCSGYFFKDAALKRMGIRLRMGCLSGYYIGGAFKSVENLICTIF